MSEISQQHIIYSIFKVQNNENLNLLLDIIFVRDFSSTLFNSHT